MRYHVLYGCCYLLSLLPFSILYGLSDVIYVIVYYLIRYRRKVVRENLQHSFPKKDNEQLRKLERAFYHYLCDSMLESLKVLSMSETEMRQRMTFGGHEQILERMKKENKQFCFVLIGHYGTWEWLASFPLWLPQGCVSSQLFHRLKNPSFDRLMQALRARFGARNIPMKEALRCIVEMKNSGKNCFVGFIADQSPKSSSIFHWTTFMGRETPVFVGAEKMGQSLKPIYAFLHFTRIKRGYYHGEFEMMDVKQSEELAYPVTEEYFHRLEDMINRHPAYWLWSHRRWKRTKAGK